MSVTGKVIPRKKGPIIETSPRIVPVQGYDPVKAVQGDSHGGKNITNPKYIGPGVWYNIHTQAKKACMNGDYNSKKAFIDLMDYYQKNFTCMNCRSHIEEYISNHPFDTYWKIIDKDKNKDIGLFKWSWEFHNAVNRRIGNPVMDWETAYGLYFGGEEGVGVCSADCGQ